MSHSKTRRIGQGCKLGWEWVPVLVLELGQLLEKELGQLLELVLVLALVPVLELALVLALVLGLREHFYILL